VLRLVTAAVLAAVLAFPGLASAEKLKPFKLKTLDGAEQTLTSVLGARATLVVFFFPTCPYCNAAFPYVQKLHDDYKTQGLSIVWINVVPEQQKLIREWQAKHGYTVPVLLGRNSTPKEYRVQATPTHYLLNAGGEILSRREGFYPGDEKTIEQDVRKALGL
jgi:thiol-disulfide isomerase/thioredoxin